MKKTTISIILSVAVFLAFSGNASALDSNKFNAFKRKNIQNTVDIVKEKGEAPAGKLKFINKFDTNKDGSIDSNEISALEGTLNA